MAFSLVGLLIGGGLSVTALAPGSADTGGAAVELEWTAPPGCPTGAEVLERVGSGPDAHPVHAEGIVHEDAGTWSLALRVEGYGGADDRTLDGESCEALADAAALLIRVATGPDAAHVAEAEGPGPQPQAEQSEEDAPGANLVDPASPPSAPEPSAPEPNPEPKPAPLVLPQRQGPPLEVHARAAGMLQLGALLPGTVAGGAALAAGVSVPWFRAEARGLYLAPRAQTDAANPGVGIDVDGWGVGPSGCGVWDAGRVFVPACLGAQLGRTRARAFGLEQPGVGRGLWAHAVADLTLGVRVSPTVALTAGAEAAVSLLRPSFHVRGFPTLFRTGVAAARGVVGVEVLLRRAPTRELR